MKTARTIYIVWALISLLITVLGAMAGLPVVAAQATIFILTVAQIAAYFLTGSQRALWNSFSTSSLTALHAWRLIPGTAFLVLHYRFGILPREFALFAGIGDITVSLLAPLAGFMATKESDLNRALLLGFQLLGLGDLLNVVRIAAKNALANPDSMRSLLEMPLALLPTILVPVTLFAHFVVLHRLARKHISAVSVTA